MDFLMLNEAQRHESVSKDAYEQLVMKYIEESYLFAMSDQRYPRVFRP